MKKRKITNLSNVKFEPFDNYGLNFKLEKFVIFLLFIRQTVLS